MSQASQGRSSAARPRLGLAVGVSAVVLIAAGVGFRSLSARLNRTSGQSPLPAGTLAGVPLQIGDWVGRDDPLDDRVRIATDTDDLINRVYSLRGGSEVVGFYVSYGARARDLQPHRPDVCYPGNGWNTRDIEFVDLPLPDGSSLACRVLKFARGGFDARAIVVVNYYIVDDTFFQDVSFVRSQAWKGQQAVDYTAQVQVACTTSAFRDEAAATQAATRFAALSATSVRDVLATARRELKQPATGSTAAPEGDQP